MRLEIIGWGWLGMSLGEGVANLGRGGVLSHECRIVTIINAIKGVTRDFGGITMRLCFRPYDFSALASDYGTLRHHVTINRGTTHNAGAAEYSYLCSYLYSCCGSYRSCIQATSQWNHDLVNGKLSPLTEAAALRTYGEGDSPLQELRYFN